MNEYAMTAAAARAPETPYEIDLLGWVVICSLLGVAFIGWLFGGKL